MLKMLSAIQPSGDLGIGHYLGAIRHWLSDQEQCDTRFMIADLHAITKPMKGSLSEKSLDLVAWFLALGLKSNPFLYNLMWPCTINWPGC